MEYLHIGPGPISTLATQYMVRMRDAVHLATDVYLPGGNVIPGDTVLIRLPYDKSGEYTFIANIAEYFMARGYRVVAQDVRGKFRSEGQALLFVNEADDGYDTIEWITQQPFSNGNVAMWGDSYYGYTQWAAVSSQHPALKAISPRVTGTQLGEPVQRAAGDITRRVEWGITLMYPLTYFHSQDAYFWDVDWTTRPYSAAAEDFMETVGARSPSYDLWYPQPVYLPRFRAGSPFDARPVPVLHVIGWWDNCAPLSWADEVELAKRPAWALNHYLRIEPMDHEGYIFLEADEDRVETRSLAQIEALLPRLLDPAIEFFEIFVRGNGRPEDIPKVSWNLAGTEGMRESSSWPPTGVRSSTLVADSAGNLVANASPDGASCGTDITWEHNPNDLVPSSVPNAFAFLSVLPDEAGIGLRSDVLVFDSRPVAHTVELVGPVTAKARIHSSGPNMDLFLRLLDVSPEGSAVRIGRGQVHLVDATQATTVEVDLGQLGYQLREGHLLRLHISSSDFPEFVPLPGTGENPWGATEVVSTTQSLLVGGADGLSLTVSILKGMLS